MDVKDRANGVAAVQAMLVGDEDGSYSHLKELDPDALHELMGMLLIVAGMARATMLTHPSQRTPHTDAPSDTTGP